MNVQVTPLPDEQEPDHTNMPDHFAVTDSESANWVVRKVVEARLYATRVEAWAAAEIRRAENEERYFLDRYGPQLERWVRQELAARGGRARSFRLPAGQLGFRSISASFRTADVGVLASWCRQHLPRALRLRIDAQGTSAAHLRALLADHDLQLAAEDGVIAADVNRHIEQTGELPPGVVAVGAEQRFFVR